MPLPGLVAIWGLRAVSSVPGGASGVLVRDCKARKPHLECPTTVSLLLFVNQCSASRLALGVGAFGRSCHGLAVLGNDRSTRCMVLSASLLHFRREGIGTYLFHRDGVPRCSGDRVFLAIVFDGVAGIYRSTVLSFPGDCHLNPAVRCLIDYGQTLDWVRHWRGGLKFGDIPLPSSNRIVSPEHPDGCDRYADNQLHYDVSHSSSIPF